MKSDLASKPVCILADESANWRIAGLRQIERLIFACEELALKRSDLAPLSIEVIWDLALQPGSRRLPERSYASTLPVREPERAAPDKATCLTTRLLITRDGLSEILTRLSDRGERPPAPENSASCRLLSDAAQIPAAERWFMNSLGKPQDGWVARHLNRPISTRISRWLIRFRARPIHATLAASLCGVAGCAIILRGDYWSVLIGAIALYGFSVLDGCDGEIARACYLDSAIGRRLDLISDTLVNVLFVICLGFGIGRFWEGIVTGLTMSASEAMLFLIGRQKNSPQTSGGSPLYERHERMLNRSGAFKINRRLVHLFAQLTKRDVAWLAFIVLAVVGAPALMLHASLLVGLIVASVAASALSRRLPTSPG